MTSYITNFVANGAFVSWQNGLSASLAAQTILANAAPGMYRLSVRLRTRTAGDGNVTATIACTDEIGAKTLDIPGALTLDANGVSRSMVLIDVDSGDITITVTQSGTGTYDLKTVLERIA